jgi:hypothetical protein
LLENALNDALTEMLKFDENYLLRRRCGFAACAIASRFKESG